MSTAFNTAQELQFNRVILAIRVLVISALVLVLGRVVQLQISPTPELAAHVQPRATTHSLGATRGDLLDRRGRVLATTRIAKRVIIDPTTIEANLDQAVMGLAGVLSVDPGRLGQKIIGAVIENNRRAAVIERMDQRERDGLGPELGSDGSPIDRPQLSQYLPISGLLDMHAAEAVKAFKDDNKLSGIFLEDHQVRQRSSDQLVGSIIGKLGFINEKATERTGILGAEQLFESQLEGTDGSLTYVRDASGGPLWVQRGAWTQEQRGDDVRLSIDLEIQRIVLEELEHGAEYADSAGARAVVMNPHTGEVLAMVDVIREIEGLVDFPWYDPKGDEPAATLPHESERPRWRVLEPDPQRGIDESLTRNRSVRDLYEPGSTFKPFVWSLAKTQGFLPDDEIIEIQGNRYNPYGRRVLTDVTPKTSLTWDGVIEFSSNIGMTIASERIDQTDLRNTIRSLGFGRRSGLGIMGEQPGIVTSSKNWSHWTQTSVAMGYEVAVTPVQMVRAFSVFARSGEMAGTLPQLRLTAAGRDDRPGLTKDEIIIERVFDPEVAVRVRGPMTIVVQRMDDKDRSVNNAPAPKYSMFGKSGTAKIPCNPPAGSRRPNNASGYFVNQYNTSFIAAAPANAPEIVVIVVIDDPGPERIKSRSHYGSRVAGPVVRRITERVLPYLGIEPDVLVED
ncbi:MAG: penicillin-binding protein 2 [Phycisphaerales bacterium]|nr:penicillin-binding protein 2 [Phycisphaerales bacterium]